MSIGQKNGGTARRPSQQVSPPPMTEAEFQNLPSSVQRKYFSTLERLQIAYYSANVYEPSAPLSRPRTAVNPIRPTTSQSHGPHARFRHAKQGDSLKLDQSNLQNESQFFHSLPEKIRRQHFSKEEQIRLQSLAEAGGPEAWPLPDTSSGRPSTNSSPSLSGQASDLPPRKDSKLPSIDLQRPSTVGIMQSFALKPKQSESGTNKLQKLPPGVELLSRPSTSSVYTLRSPTAGAPLSPSFTNFSHPSHHRRKSSRSISNSIFRPSLDSNLSLDPAATYYQDPEARKKLRLYLASPQKFDEAVAFGFPSLSAKNSVFETEGTQMRRKLSNRKAHEFLKTNVITLLDYHSDASDDESVADLPRSPEEVKAARPVPRPISFGSSIFSGLDASTLPSLDFQFEGMPQIAEAPSPKASLESQNKELFDPSDPLANREMTLRMTLTRPELRATDSELYGWDAKEKELSEERDPLALEKLNLSDDTTGRNGAFAVKPERSRQRRSGVFRRLFIGKKRI